MKPDQASLEAMNALVEKISENKNRILGCPGPHAWEIIKESPIKGMAFRYQCSKCGGLVTSEGCFMYEQGLRDHSV